MSEETATPVAPPAGPPLTGRALRRLTKQAMQSHGGGSMGELVGEVYTVVLSIGIAVAMAVGLTEVLNTALRPTTTEPTLDPAWLAVVVALALVGLAVGLAARLGPMGVGGGQAAWWLPTPVDRRGLLRPRLLVTVAVAAGAGAVVGLLAGGLAGEVGPGLGAAAAVGAVAGTVSVLAVARGQTAGRGRSQPVAVTIGETLLVLAPLIALTAAVVRPDPPPAPPAAALLGVVVALLVGAVALGLATERRLDAVSGAELRARGAVTAYAAGAAQALDTRELGRALTITAQKDRRRRSRNLAFVRGPVVAIATGDALVTLRARRHVIQVLVTAVLPVVVALAGWASFAVVIAIVAAGYAAALATAEGARRAEMAPVLDRSFPLAASHVRRARLVWPALVMTVWMAVTVGVWAWLSGLAPLTWLPLAIVAGPALAAGAVRGAYRRPTDWSQPLVSNPFGPPIPPGLFATVSRGPDVVVIGLIPLILGVVAVASPVTLFWWQVLATLVVGAIAAHVPDPKGGLMAAAARK